MSAMESPSSRDAREAVALAVRLHGHKRGWHLAAMRLGISERTARALTYGETTGATIHPDTAARARMEFRRARAAAIRAELTQLEAECGECWSGSAASLDGPATAAGMGPNGVRGGRGA